MSDPVDTNSAIGGAVVMGGIALAWKLISGSFSRNVSANDTAIIELKASSKAATELAESAARSASTIAAALGEIKGDVKSALSELRAVHDEQIRQVATLEMMRERLTRVEASSSAAHTRGDEMERRLGRLEGTSP